MAAIIITIIISATVGTMWALCASGKTAPQCDLCKHKDLCENDSESYFCCFERREDEDEKL